MLPPLLADLRPVRTLPRLSLVVPASVLIVVVRGTLVRLPGLVPAVWFILCSRLLTVVRGGGHLTLLVVCAGVQLSVKAAVVGFTAVVCVVTVAARMMLAEVRRALVVAMRLGMEFGTTVTAGIAEQVTRLPERLLSHVLLVTHAVLVVLVCWGSSVRVEMLVRHFCCGSVV